MSMRLTIASVLVICSALPAWAESMSNQSAPYAAPPQSQQGRGRPPELASVCQTPRFSCVMPRPFARGYDCQCVTRSGARVLGFIR